ncbi:MAG: hypothetical protein ACK5WM_18170 [Rhodospirillales bacterium]
MRETIENLSDGQRASEARRAAKAGMTLEQWLAHKAKQRTVAAAAEASGTAKAPATPGLMSRLLGRLGGKR